MKIQLNMFVLPLTQVMMRSHLHVLKKHERRSSRNWVGRGSYGVYVAIIGPMWLLRGLRGANWTVIFYNRS